MQSIQSGLACNVTMDMSLTPNIYSNRPVVNAELEASVDMLHNQVLSLMMSPVWQPPSAAIGTNLESQALYANHSLIIPAMGRADFNLTS